VQDPNKHCDMKAKTSKKKFAVPRRGTIEDEKRGAELMLAICGALAVPAEALVGYSRAHGLPDVRHMTAYLMRDFVPQLSYRQIGMLIGRTHCHVIYGIDVAKTRIAVEDEQFMAAFLIAHKAAKKWHKKSM